MAKRKIQIIPPDGGYVDVLHPETSADQVQLADVGGNFTATNVEGALSELFQNVSDGKQLVASAITGIGQSASGSDTFVTLANKINAVPKKTAQTYTPSTVNQTIASGQYLSGTQTISAVAGLSAGNIKTGATIGGVTGTYKGYGTTTAANVLSGQTFSTASLASATGTMVNRGAVTNTITTQGGSYTVPVGYHSGAGKVTASFSNLSAGNVKNGVNIGGVVGNVKPALVLTALHTQGLNRNSSIAWKYNENSANPNYIKIPKNGSGSFDYFLVKLDHGTTDINLALSATDTIYWGICLNGGSGSSAMTWYSGTSFPYGMFSNGNYWTVIFNPNKATITVSQLNQEVYFRSFID